MAVREYVGMRVVPILGRIGEDSVMWDGGQYEPLTIVMTTDGSTYISRCFVPADTEITNTHYWAKFAEFNAQFALLQQTVETYNARINQAQADATAASTAVESLGTTVEEGFADVDATIEGLQQTLTEVTQQLAGTTTSGLKTLIDGNSSDIAQLQQAVAPKTHFGVIGDSFSNEVGEWPTLLGATIGLTPVVKAVNASGFVTGTTFINQLASLQADANWGNLAFIIVYGGTNDYAAAGASVAQMQSAFDAFKTAYESITDAPKLIFAFGNLGSPTRSAYNGIGPWYASLTEYLRTIAMPGFVDNVIFWLFPFNRADVIGSDLLHPTALGHKAISNYFEQILNGSYSGVRGYEVVESVDGTVRSIITFVNGQWTVCTKCEETPVSAYNTYINVGTATHSYAFGTIGGTEGNPELFRGLMGFLLNFSQSIFEAQYALFNPINKNVYIRLTGNAGNDSVSGTGSVTGNCL